MQVIVINSQKGGSAKTMLAKHLSVEAERAGDGPVFLIDTDPQGSLTAWHAKRESESPALAEVAFEGLEKGLAVIRSHGAAYCILDTGSGRLEIATELFKLADFVVFPVQPSEDDLTAAPKTVQALKAVAVPFVFVLTRVKPGTLITAQAAAVLSRHGEVAETFVNDRTGYKSPYPKGQTVTEAEPRGAAAKEIAALWANIKACVHASMQEKGRYRLMAKALRIDADILDTAPPVPQAAQVKAPPEAAAPTGKKGSPKVGQIPLQVRWPRTEVKAAKLAAVEFDFPTMSDFMLACFHAYMESRKQS